MAGLSTNAAAAPVVGPPFFLANPHSDTADFSIASSSNGFVLAWSAAGDTWAQRYTTSAGITGSPFLLAKGGSSMVPSSHQSISTSRVEVVSNGVDLAARWVNYTTLAICCTGFYNWEDFGSAVIRASGAPEAPGPFAIGGSLTSRPFGAIATASADWVALNSLLNITPPNTGAQWATVNWVAPDGTASEASLFADGSLVAASYSSFGVASVGATALATWLPPAPAGRAFAIAEKTGTVTPLTNAALPTAAESVLVAANGADYFVVWPAAGSVRALRVSSTGAVVGAPIVVWNGSDAGAVPAIVSVKAGGSAYLILFRHAAGDGGSTLFGSRVLADGTLLDPSGFEVPAGAGVALTDVADDLWLLATLDSLNGASIIRGRYIGATKVPTPPDNVEPPLPPDAGAVPDAAAVRDAAVVPDAAIATGGAATSAGGVPTIGSGGDNRGGRATGTGGRSSGGDGPTVSDGGLAARGTDGNRATTGGCGCVFARSEPARSRVAVPLWALAFTAGAMRRSRRVTSRWR
jgi:hypothetical protein